MGNATLMAAITLAIALILTLSHVTFGLQPIQPINQALSGFNYVGGLKGGNEVLITIYVPLRNINLLYSYLYAISNPQSPMYRHFLTRGEVEELFYPEAEFNETLTYLKSHGFHILLTAADSIIVAEANASLAEHYLGLRYFTYSNGALSYYEAFGEVKIGNFHVLAYSSNLTALFFIKPPMLITANQLDNFKDELPRGIGLEVNLTFPIEAYWPTLLQRAYNASALYRLGFMGQNYTIGILDFFGDPYVVQDLSTFDKVVGLPNPPSFQIIPIGPYNPNLGVVTGWVYEIDLDVEVAHAMAPNASLVLYVANPALPLSAIIAYIDSQDAVDVVSQSFGFPESALSQVGGGAFYFNVYLTDVYYALGSVEGITFVAASGDGGGSGYSNGPLGSVAYPSSSPYVTSVGGTSVYPELPNGSFYQTAWSSYGFIPLDMNLGGSTGGVSVVEPKPWYQWGISQPETYPYGRMTPDLAMDASPFPGLLIIGPLNQTVIVGGTSAAAPILAGLLTLVMDYVHGRLGLINPTLYSLLNTAWYGKAIVPITYGYNIPWTAHYGYNLVTGLGTINVGYLAEAFNETQQANGISISVHVYNESLRPQRQYYPGQVIVVEASITYNNLPVTRGNFTAVVEGVWGNVTKAPLTYVGLGMWQAYITLPANATGVLNIVVYGEYNGTFGAGFATIFSGYYAKFLAPSVFQPILASQGYEVKVNLTNIYDLQPLNASEINLTAIIYYYNYLNNSYVEVSSIELTPMRTFKGYLWVGELPQNLPTGVLFIRIDGSYGFLPFVNGVMLQSLYLIPMVVAQPGSAAPGQGVVIFGYIIPPTNLVKTSQWSGVPVMYSVFFGSNITAYLIAPNGTVISSTYVNYNPMLNMYFGILRIPDGVEGGLYTIALNSTYYSYTLNTTISGSFFSQIYVAPFSLRVKAWVEPSYPSQGQLVRVYANITYPNGTVVRYGMFSATVYPINLAYAYSAISQLVEVPLWFNSTLGLWVGNFTVPSQYSLGSLTYLAGNLYFSSPFGVLVSGVSADGTPTPVTLANEAVFNVLPYVIIRGATLANPTMYHALLVNTTLIGGTYAYSMLVNVTLIGDVTLINCNASNVVLRNASVTLISSTLNMLNAYSSSIRAIMSYLKDVNLVNSTIINESSIVVGIRPRPPEVIVEVPDNGLGLRGIVPINVTIIGSSVNSTAIYLDGILLVEYNSNGTHVYMLNTANYPDGTYRLAIYVTQSDGVVVSKVVELTFENNMYSIYGEVNETLNQLRSLSSQLGVSASELSSELAILEALVLVAIALAAAALSWQLASRVARR